jgi:hypothetical protein
LYGLQGVTFSAAVRRLVDQDYPESTVKYVLHRLKRFNLIDFGNHERKGEPLVFTDLGNTFFEILRGESK